MKIVCVSCYNVSKGSRIGTAAYNRGDFFNLFTESFATATYFWAVLNVSTSSYKTFFVTSFL